MEKYRKCKPISLPNPTVSNLTIVRDAISDLAFLESGEGNFKQEYLIVPQSEYQKKYGIMYHQQLI